MSIRLLALVCAVALAAETFAAPTTTTLDEPIIVRSKRQQCRCVKNPNGGLTCSCAKGPATASSAATAPGTSAQHDVPQSADIANQLTAMQSPQQMGSGQARCGCIQIVFQGTPQYNCQCGEPNGQILPTSTTTTTSTLAPTTTTSTTTTTTPAPITEPATTAPTSYTQMPTNTQGNGACNCVMISISSPQTAQYQCQCANQQQQAAQYPMETYDYTQVYQSNTEAPVAPSTTTMAPITTTTMPQMLDAATPAAAAPSQYPLTTTCVMYVNVPTTACSCLPQYDQCAQNVCCLKAKYRSYKKAEETAPSSTIDMLMNVLKTIKTKLE